MKPGMRVEFQPVAAAPIEQGTVMKPRKVHLPLHPDWCLVRLDGGDVVRAHHSAFQPKPAEGN